MKNLISSITVLFAIVLGLAACGGGADDSAEATSADGVENPLPDVQLELMTGGTYELRQTGTPRALNLWATWCAPCRAELPAFNDVAKRVEGVEIIGVNTGDDSTAAAELADELGLNFTQILDPNALVQSDLRITGMPATIFVDNTGEIVDIHSGELDTTELESLLTGHFAATFAPTN